MQHKRTGSPLVICTKYSRSNIPCRYFFRDPKVSQQHQFALAEDPLQVTEVHTALVEYMVNFSELAYLQLKCNDQALWLEKLDKEHPNLQYTAQWCLEEFKIDPKMNQGFMESLFNIIYFLIDFLCLRGFTREALTWLETAFDSAQEIQLSPLLNAKALFCTGNIVSCHIYT